MKFCSKCGNALDNTKKFCNKCGAPNAAFAPPAAINPSDNELLRLQLQKEQIERELEKKAQEELQRKEELRLNQERAQKEALEREQIERRNKEAAELKSRQLDELLKQQDKEKLIEEQSEILQKVKLERELLERELDKIAELRLKKEQVTKNAAPAPPVTPSQAVQKSKTGKKVLQTFVILLILLAIVVGVFFAYQKFMLVDPYQQAIKEINARQWSEASQDLKKTIDGNNKLSAAKQRSQAELDNINLWQTGTSLTGVAIQYPGILLSGSNPAVKDYINVLAKFKKIPFSQLTQNTLAGININTVLEPVYLLHDSVELGLIQNILKDPAKLSIQNGALIYNDGYEQLNEDTLETDLLNKKNPAITAWYNQLQSQKSKALEGMNPQLVTKAKTEPVQVQVFNATKPKWAPAKKVTPDMKPVPAETEAPKRNAD